ncbi:serine/threonine protein kinase [Caballeronia arationis]|jgi:serine/threonine-protein kinase|uniref:non-specific serine/threonine protein kinase n=1 Tax=Caballeronia arationis TaxID=1777142 RepID=A0A7Z7IG86_9BURK|nr:serine/threonine-protein kinase [Caballeronia arationis]SAK86312.1 serine/threonine protein kinase [Caballeronia arationis]SOE89492.1 serine/threonine protein kinase [Caballeronia arationis]
MEPPPVRSLGRYRIEGTLGAGAMGVVYRAFDPRLDRLVALKTIRHELFETGERASLMARFRNEAQAAGRLSHPNIVGVYDYGETQDTAYIAMEFVAGRGLDVLLDASSGPVEVYTALGWFSQLLAALGFAHAHGIVHRDIKPANLLVTEHGRLQVTDFGIAHVESSTLTVVGSVVGTPSYMSPEQFSGAPADGRSDLFSAAVVLYQMLTGQRPFVGSSPVAVMQQVLRETPRAPSLCNPALPAAFDEVLMRALSKDPAARFQTPAALQQALTDAMGPSGNAHGDHEIDRTVLVTAASGQTGSTAPATDSWRGDCVGSPAAWSTATLAGIEARLASQVGPVARLLVARGAARTAELSALVALLAPHIPSDKGRRQFTDAFADDVQTCATHRATPPDGSHLPHPSVEETQAAALKLAVYLGPIANILARREAARAASLQALYESLAITITNEHDRARFRRDVGLQ